MIEHYKAKQDGDQVNNYIQANRIHMLPRRILRCFSKSTLKRVLLHKTKKQCQKWIFAVDKAKNRRLRCLLLDADYAFSRSCWQLFWVRLTWAEAWKAVCYHFFIISLYPCVAEDRLPFIGNTLKNIMLIGVWIN